MREIRKQIPKGGIVIKLFASFFFAGHLPKAPGTWGSGFAAIILFFVWPPQWYYQFLAIFVIYLFGAFVAGKAERYYGHDGRQIVIDEVAGQMVALFMAPRKLMVYMLAFLLFRIFDIIKPPPARQWENMHGGWGIMADDVAAGVYAAVIVQFLLALANKWGVGII